MRSYLPRMSITPPDAPGLRPKFGGLPWGLPPERWPLCRCCGEPMSAMAQIPVRGNLDRVDWNAARADMADRVLHLFTCERPSVCPFWELEDGANTAFFLRESELGDAASVPPEGSGAPVAHASRGKDGKSVLPPSPIAPPLLPEVWITAWEPHDDAVPPEIADDFMDWEQHSRLPEDLRDPHDFDSEFQTKIGGVPYWTGNGPGSVAPSPFRYALQIDLFLHVIEDNEPIMLANFCSDGTGYLYIDATAPEARALFAINR